jgi:hypothetical protein
MLGSTSTAVSSVVAALQRIRIGNTRRILFVLSTRRSFLGEVRLLPHELYHNGLFCTENSAFTLSTRVLCSKYIVSSV